MRLLIVDDEAHWVDNLSITKPWHSIGIQEVYKAYTPHEALRIIETNPIDIVISDIVMPEISGIELIERIHRMNEEIKCILLSGHSDFEFAKQAVQRQAVDYVLKPPTDEELFGAVRNAIEQLQQKRESGGSYERALSVFRQKVRDQRDLIMRINDAKNCPSVEPLQSMDQPPSLIHLLEAGCWEAVEDKLVRVFEELDGRWSGSWEHCMEAGFRIASSYSHFAHKSGRSLAELLGQDFELLLDGEPFRSISTLRAWSLQALKKLKEQSSVEIKASRYLYVRKIQEFVDQNMYRDVSLRAMADHVNLHPTHLSKIYKMETGEGISDYLFRLRMEKACYLLKSTGKKVYEVGSDIGYVDPAYFIKVFKRRFGLTPQEFREHPVLA